MSEVNELVAIESGQLLYVHIKEYGVNLASTCRIMCINKRKDIYVNLLDMSYVTGEGLDLILAECAFSVLFNKPETHQYRLVKICSETEAYQSGERFEILPDVIYSNLDRACIVYTKVKPQ